jgi:hypothetical protein
VMMVPCLICRSCSVYLISTTTAVLMLIYSAACLTLGKTHPLPPRLISMTCTVSAVGTGPGYLIGMHLHMTSTDSTLVSKFIDSGEHSTAARGLAGNTQPAPIPECKFINSDTKEWRCCP